MPKGSEKQKMKVLPLGKEELPANQSAVPADLPMVGRHWYFAWDHTFHLKFILMGSALQMARSIYGHWLLFHAVSFFELQAPDTPTIRKGNLWVTSWMSSFFLDFLIIKKDAKWVFCQKMFSIVENWCLKMRFLIVYKPNMYYNYVSWPVESFYLEFYCIATKCLK